MMKKLFNGSKSSITNWLIMLKCLTRLLSLPMSPITAMRFKSLGSIIIKIRIRAPTVKILMTPRIPRTTTLRRRVTTQKVIPKTQMTLRTQRKLLLMRMTQKKMKRIPKLNPMHQSRRIQL